jgi:hypothetical protein
MTIAATQQKPRISAIEKSRRNARQNASTGKKLSIAANTYKDTAADVTADLLKLSAYPKASGELRNLKDKKGRAFNCPHSFISASSILDTNYQKTTARRHRKTIYEAFKTHLPDVIRHSLDVTFLTPTFPNLLGVGFAQNDEFQTLAWQLFLQTKTFADFFYAGYSKTEVTLGNRAARTKEKRAFDLKLDGLNYHSHALTITFQPLADGNTPDIENKLAFMRKNGAQAQEKRPLLNSLKVVSAWSVCVEKAHKEIFGAELRIKTNSHRARFSFQKVSLGEIKEYDDDESKNGIFWEIGKTSSYLGKAASFKDLPPELLLEAENVFRNKRLINPFGVFRKYVQKDSQDADSFINQSTQQSENSHSDAFKSLLNSELRAKNEPLKSYGIRLCEQGKRSVWLEYLKENIDGIIKKRRDALLRRFPNAVFTDLSGKSYTVADIRDEFRLTTLRDTDEGAWYSSRIESRQSRGILESLRQLERGITAQPIPLDADAFRSEPSNSATAPYTLLHTAPSGSVSLSSNWQLFDSFCDLGACAEKENSFR